MEPVKERADLTSASSKDDNRRHEFVDGAPFAEPPTTDQQVSKKIKTDSASSDTTMNEKDENYDLALLSREIQNLPVWRRNRNLCRYLMETVLPRWKADYHRHTEADASVESRDTGEGGPSSHSPLSSNSDPARIRNVAWKGIRKRFAKELNECEPIVMYLQNAVQDYHKKGDASTKPLPTILDLCSGFGICSMILSEVLSCPNYATIDASSSSDNASGLKQPVVSRIVLIDYSWPCPKIAKTSTKPPDPRRPKVHVPNLSTLHLTSRSWPIPLFPKKRNLKAGRQFRQIVNYDIEPSPGPVFVFGIHLCKALSVKAIQLFASSDKITQFILKPCCLPGQRMLRIKPPIVWTFGNQNESFVSDSSKSSSSYFEFTAHDVYDVSEEDATGDAPTDKSKDVLNSTREVSETKITEEDVGDDESTSVFGSSHRDPNFTNKRYDRWVGLLEKGCRCCVGSRSTQSDDGPAVMDLQVKVVQHDLMRRSFQNKIIYCMRQKVDA